MSGEVSDFPALATCLMAESPETATKGPNTNFDVIVVGAGISGINFAYRLQTQLPGCTYAILEARNTIGGTWDLFQFPGIRSDSDLHTFGPTTIHRFQH